MLYFKICEDLAEGLMRKKIQKLALSRETLRSLQASAAGMGDVEFSQSTICELCPESEPSKCIICYECTQYNCAPGMG